MFVLREKMSAEAQGRLPTDGTDAFVETETQNLEGPWPELVGISVGDAEQILRALRPDLIIQLVHQVYYSVSPLITA